MREAYGQCAACVYPHQLDATTIMTSLNEKVNELLDDESYDIEFHGFLSNHLKHAVIALHGLGAKSDYIEDYCKKYAEGAYGFGLEAAKESDAHVTEENWRTYLGKHKQFGALRSFFASRADELGLDEMLRVYVPQLLAGCVGSLLHGTIHLGWAIGAGHHGMTVEGIAYLAFSFVSCYPDRDVLHNECEEQTVLETLLRICGEWDDKADELKLWVDATLSSEQLSPSSGFQPVLENTGLQLRIAQVLQEGHPILDDVPHWLHSKSVSELWQQLYETVSLIYLCHPGNFFVLHLVTCLYGVRKIGSKLSEDYQRLAIKCFWKSMVGVLFATKAFPLRQKLLCLMDKHCETRDLFKSAEIQRNWSRLFKRAIADSEEHNAKLVYVMFKAWKEFGRKTIFRVAASHFTITPTVK